MKRKKQNDQAEATALEPTSIEYPNLTLEWPRPEAIVTDNKDPDAIRRRARSAGVIESLSQKYTVAAEPRRFPH